MQKLICSSARRYTPTIRYLPHQTCPSFCNHSYWFSLVSCFLHLSSLPFFSSSSLNCSWQGAAPICKHKTIEPRLLFMGHRQTVQNQIRHRIMQCLIRIFTVFLEYVLLKSKNKWKNQPNTPTLGNGFVLLISVRKSIRFKWVKTNEPADKIFVLIPLLSNKDSD